MNRTHLVRLLAIAAVPVVSILINGRDNDPRQLFRRPEPQNLRPIGTSGRLAPPAASDEVAAEPRQDPLLPKLTVPAPTSAVEQELPGTGPAAKAVAGFGNGCETRDNGNDVVRYDHLANRWLIVMPTFAHTPVRDHQPPVSHFGDYLKKDAANDSSAIGAVQTPDCQ